MNPTTFTSSAPKTPAPLLAAAERARKASYWTFVANCCLGRRTQSRPGLSQKSAVLPGMVLEATDRRYIVGQNGAWRRASRVEDLPASKSQIRLLPTPSRNKY